MLLDLRSLYEVSAGFVYSASGGIAFGGSATVVGPAARDDSRGWYRYHAHAVASSVHAHAKISGVTISAGSIAVATGSHAVARIGQVRARGESSAQTRFSRSPASTGIISVAASAVAPVIGSTVQVRSGSVSASATVSISVGAPVNGQRLRTSVGRVSVEIGPDLVQMEEDELLFLLEVA